MGEPILKIEMNEMDNYVCLASGEGLGSKSQTVINDYCGRLNKITHESFGPGDNCTAHSVINSLSEETRKIGEAMGDVDILLDSLIEIIQEDVINKENQIVTLISEVRFDG